MTQPDPAYAQLMTTMRSAIDTYMLVLDEEGRREYETCDCLLHQGMREMRAAVEAYEAELGLDMARTVLLQVLGRRG